VPVRVGLPYGQAQMSRSFGRLISYFVVSILRVEEVDSQISRANTGQKAACGKLVAKITFSCCKKYFE